MTIGHVFLMLAVVSFGLLGVMHKVAGHRGCRPEGANLMLFFGATVLIFGVAVWHNGWAKALDVPLAGWQVATGCGVLSSLAILNFQHGVRFGKISTSWLIINLSTALPTVLSILIYREAVSLRRALGLALAAMALFILWLERAREEKATGRVAAAKQSNGI